MISGLVPTMISSFSFPLFLNMNVPPLSVCIVFYDLSGLDLGTGRDRIVSLDRSVQADMTPFPDDAVMIDDSSAVDDASFFDQDIGIDNRHRQYHTAGPYRCLGAYIGSGMYKGSDTTLVLFQPAQPFHTDRVVSKGRIEFCICILIF